MHDKVFIIWVPFLVMHREFIDGKNTILHPPWTPVSWSWTAQSVPRPVHWWPGTAGGAHSSWGRVKIETIRGAYISWGRGIKIRQLLKNIWPKPLYNRSVIKMNTGIMPIYIIIHMCNMPIYNFTQSYVISNFSTKGYSLKIYFCRNFCHIHVLT